MEIKAGFSMRQVFIMIIEQRRTQILDRKMGQEDGEVTGRKGTGTGDDDRKNLLFMLPLLVLRTFSPLFFHPK